MPKCPMPEPHPLDPFICNHPASSLQRLINVSSYVNGDMDDLRSVSASEEQRVVGLLVYRRSSSLTIVSSSSSGHLQSLSVSMATHINEVNKNMAKHLLHLVSETSKNLKMMEVTDHFELLLELGTGSYGKVYMGKHKPSGQIRAIKMMAKKKTPADIFLLEYCISQTLSCHQNIIFTHDVFFHTSRDFVFVQEVAPAGNLQSILQPKVGMQEDMVKRCIFQIANALDFMHHRGMVHRDIKPNNILLMDAECHWVKLADFGLTRLQGTSVSSVSWYKPFTAPELCCLRPGDQLLLHPSLDVWAFGVLIYFMLSGFFPWHAAVRRDHEYKEFAWWQVKKDIYKAPEKWNKISVEARKMFWELLAINACERRSTIDVLKYMDLPWKAEIFSEPITT
ncbi:serine/threonine-protein kinase SBK1-like [Anomaloglossus baeobatrachus]|uniref:serine/threonine-protein kinase SBK1-like n=1 Tax=Anomaloglossus baeobatrachus TaxID=238106 RepID=UPI003F50A9B3